jgi:hypothetical protein
VFQLAPTAFSASRLRVTNLRLHEFLQVDERLNGDGVGLAFGVNEPILGWILAGVFGLVWTLYAVSAKSFGQQDEEDGLSL